MGTPPCSYGNPTLWSQGERLPVRLGKKGVSQYHGVISQYYGVIFQYYGVIFQYYGVIYPQTKISHLK
jgi:hypothetical protein